MEAGHCNYIWHFSFFSQGILIFVKEKSWGILKADFCGNHVVTPTSTTVASSSSRAVHLRLTIWKLKLLIVRAAQSSLASTSILAFTSIFLLWSAQEFLLIGKIPPKNFEAVACLPFIACKRRTYLKHYIFFRDYSSAMDSFHGESKSNQGHFYCRHF